MMLSFLKRFLCASFVVLISTGMVVADNVEKTWPFRTIDNSPKLNYGVLGGGIMVWPDTSNSDEVESGTESGMLLSMAVGRKFIIAPTFDIRGEIEATAHSHDLHGRNDSGKSTADGQVFRATGIGVNVWPTYSPFEVDNVTAGVYAGGGAGVAELSAFGNSGVAGKFTTGAGLWVEVDNWVIDAGFRYFITTPTNLDGAIAEYDSYGPVLRIGLKF